MTHIVTVATTGLPGRWPRSTRLLVMDTESAQHYLVVTVTSPWWLGESFSLVYPSNRLGQVRSIPGWLEGRPRLVAGGRMDQSGAVSDLTHRLMTGTTLSEVNGAILEAELIDADIEAFSAYIGSRHEQS